MAYVARYTTYRLSQLFAGGLTGHNITGSNIIIEAIMMNDDRNGSVYGRLQKKVNVS